MKRIALSVMLTVPVGLSACTTVDLSQVSVQNQPEAEAPKVQNVVERASTELTSSFRKNGWCSGSPQERTQTATSVLLNGMPSDVSKKQQTKIAVANSDQLIEFLAFANDQVVQTTKAAEVFLTMSIDGEELDSELSLLETALLSAREAESRFGQALTVQNTAVGQRSFENLKTSVKALKTVTDQYGERARMSIASKASKSRS